MLTPSLNTVLTRLLIVAAVLATLIIFVLPATFAQAEEHDTVTYPENGADVVRTFTSTDPEGAGIDWDVTGVDADDFLIDDQGRLTFKSPPNYESPTDREYNADGMGDIDTNGKGGDFAGGDNMYQITVRATEQMTSGADSRALSTETRVTVTVIDVNEPGSVTLNRLQPEVGTEITATLSDSDRKKGITGANDSFNSTVTWQWYVSKVTDPVADAPNHWIVATGNGAMDEAYTPAGDRVGTDNDSAMDEGKMLRVVATYADRRGNEREAIAVSQYPVRAEVTTASENANPENGSPGFSSAGDYTRTVSESIGKGMPVGDPVVATDPNDDTLTYELVANADSTDDDHFRIDMATGQISVAMALDYEGSSSGVYTFDVRAIDPSGESAEVEVTVTATDANDAPVIMGSSATSGDSPPAASELRVNEKDDDKGAAPYDGKPDMLLLEEGGGRGNPNVFTADDQDARGQIFWELEGEDADDFELSSSSDDPTTGLTGPDEPIALRFKNPPDYENPTDANMDSVYKVTLVAKDSPGATDTRPLTIFVDNVPEKGKVTLDKEQPLIGEPVTAVVEDPDNGVAIVTWHWQRATSTADNAVWKVIPGATTATYTPHGVDDDKTDRNENDDGYYLRVTATYTDILSESDNLETTDTDERTQTASNMAKTPVTDDSPDAVYRVTATSKNAVRVGPTDPETDGPPQFAMANYDRMVVENAEVGTIVGDPVQAVPELDDKGKVKTDFKYDIDATVTGDDSYFTIDTDSGQIRVGEVDFPDPVPAEVDQNCDRDDENTGKPDCPANDDPILDYEGANTFTLVVTAKDGNDSSRTAMTTVTVSLENLNESPYFDRETRDRVDEAIEYGEQRTNAIVQLAGVEPDGHDLKWEVTGADASDFMIMDADDINDGKDRVRLMFKSQPDFESPKDAAGDTNGDGTISGNDEEARDNFYHVTVRATEMTAVGGGPKKSGELEVTVQVTNAKEPGSVDFGLLQPEVGTDITASVSDPDGVTPSSEDWTWYRAKVSNPNRNPGTGTDALANEWELIDSAKSDTYTPQGVDNDVSPPSGTKTDEGLYLLARVEYDDVAGTSTAVGITAYATRADVSDAANNSPDFSTDTTEREVPEDTAVGMPVGDPVDVDTNEDDDVLTYSLVADSNSKENADDAGFFSIDKATGQIMVKKTLSAEMTDGRDYGKDSDATPGEYVVVVRAIDPSGEGGGEDRDDITVTITATDVNEAPRVTDGMAELTVKEADEGNKNFYIGLGNATTSKNGVEIDLNANDENLYHRDEEDIVDRAIWPEPIAGDDGHLFEYSVPDDGIGRRLHFKSPPNYEDPMDADRDNVYEVTIVVRDDDGASGQKSVRITVMNVDEAGELTISPEQPDDGAPIVATLTDPDGVVVITDWKWFATTSRDRMDADQVSEATTSEYTAEVGEFVWAEVRYRDGASVENDPVTALDERNDDPETGDTENKKFGSDASDNTAHNSDEMIEEGTVNAVQTDPDPPDDPDAPATGVVLMERMVYENVPSTGYVGDPIEDLGDRDEIGGPDGTVFVFAEDWDDNTGQGYYDEDLVDAKDDGLDKVGQLALAPVHHLDYEGDKNTYVIEVTYPDSGVEISTYRVTITVMDVNEAPTAPSELRGAAPGPSNTAPSFDAASATRMVAENTAAGMDIGDPVMAMDDDRGDTLTYSLSGADAGSFDIDSATGQLMTQAALDYEMKTEYMVTVTATDEAGESAMIDVTVMVTNVGLDNAYDSDDSGDIERPEVIGAINDYLFNNALDRPGVIAVINLYLFG